MCSLPSFQKLQFWKKKCPQHNKTIEGVFEEEWVKEKYLELPCVSLLTMFQLVIGLFQKLEEIYANNLKTLELDSKKSNIFHFQCSFVYIVSVYI